MSLVALIGASSSKSRSADSSSAPMAQSAGCDCRICCGNSHTLGAVSPGQAQSGRHLRPVPFSGWTGWRSERPACRAAQSAGGRNSRRIREVAHPPWTALLRLEYRGPW